MTIPEGWITEEVILAGKLAIRGRTLRYGEITVTVRDEDAEVLASAVLRAAAEFAAAPTPPDPWQEISTAPKDGTEILVWMFGNTFSVVSYEISANNAQHYVWMAPEGYLYHKDAPTHWLPLPPPPATLSPPDGK